MIDIQMDEAVTSEVVITALTHLKEGEITEAIACFAEKFQFKDRGIGLEFNNPSRLVEFFEKSRELYPDSSLQTNHVIVSGSHVIIEWTLRMTLNKPFYGGLFRHVPIEVHGASIVRTANGKITEWTDYYDGLASRRTSLAAHFEEWVEL